MGRLIGVVGKSGSGKTTALRNVPPEELMIILPNQKTQLPFPGGKKNFTKYDKTTKKGNLIITSNLSNIAPILKEINDTLPHIKTVVIDDFTHFFNAETQSDAFRAKTSGGEAFKKWADLAAKVYNAIFRIDELRDDLTLILNFHPEEEDSFDGLTMKIKTPGKLLDRDIDIPSYFTYLLYTKVLPPAKGMAQADRYIFVTNDDGCRPAKTPMGCFADLEIPNDMKVVLDAINQYENN